MALEDIFRALEEQAERDVAQVMDDAKSHAAVILDEARTQADAARDARVADAERMARAQSTHSLNAARLEARKRQASVKDRAIDTVFDDALARLKDARSQADYGQVFEKLAREAMQGIEGDLEVLVDPADADIAKQVLGSLGKSARVRTDIATSGGLVVLTDGGHISRRNTLEDRLEKLRSIAQADVAAIVFA